MDEVLNLEQGAAVLGICSKTLKKYWRLGMVPGRRLGKGYRFLKSDLLGFAHGGSNRNPS